MSFLPYNYQPSFSPYPSYSYPFAQSLATPAPVYTLLIIGMMMFMAANVMPNLIPEADRLWHVAPMDLQWGFLIIIFALMVQMLGIVPGVPQLHITYVHMAIASLLFILMWNHTVSDIPTPKEEKKPSSSSSSSRQKPREEKKEKKEEKPEEPSPWDDLRAHPSAFLTTRLNKLMPWPFPMGRASRKGNELWWEKGMPSHVGHFDKPDPDILKKEKEEEAKRKKEKEKARLKEEEKVKEAEKAKEKERAKKEAEAKEKMKEEESRRAKEEAKRKKEQTERKAMEDRHKQKLWRTKWLAMIIGISLHSNSASESTPSRSSAASGSTSTSARQSSRAAQEEKEKLAKLAALKETEKAAQSEKSRPTSSSASSPTPRDTPKSSGGSSSSRSSSSSSSGSDSKDKERSRAPESDKKAPSSTIVTNADPDGGGIGVPYRVGFGMHYIHTPDAAKKQDLVLPSMTIPSTGMSHPPLTTTYRQYAN
uniref:Uncharacterized protein n=1 Tax=Kwoniella dejecticola CBS 10117 TaxID=1296121 RepID=A0A1A6A2W5_9TREE|nr:uncharacterized protein I303_05251 [Kwoniella dejecticola CBS 10117]OBR84393.1 hypothetical protein I303_05251 [Kwoniella dejecticola CBS 10117]